MTLTKQSEFLLIKPSEFTELANVHTEGISPARIFEISIAVKDRSRPAPSPQTLDELCNIDLTHYVWGEMLAEDVRKCEGISCNYCGRYNK